MRPVMSSSLLATSHILWAQSSLLMGRRTPSPPSSFCLSASLYLPLFLRSTGERQGPSVSVRMTQLSSSVLSPFVAVATFDPSRCQRWQKHRKKDEEEKGEITGVEKKALLLYESTFCSSEDLFFCRCVAGTHR